MTAPTGRSRQRDTITVRGLRAYGRHGVLPSERRDGQLFVVDAELRVDTRAAAASDDLADTVDYAALAAALSGVVTGAPVALLETLADRLAHRCLADPRVESAVVTVHKPAAPVGRPVSDVTVTVRRGRRRVVLALGSNLGDSAATLQGAVDALRAALGPLRPSPVVHSEPLDAPAGSPPFLNAVVLARPAETLPLRAVLAAAQAAERAAGRQRGQRNAPRTLDVDIVDVTGVRSDDPELTLPHPRAADRAFVLLPWLALDPRARLTGAGPLRALVAALPAAAVAGVQPAPVTLR